MFRKIVKLAVVVAGVRILRFFIRERNVEYTTTDSRMDYVSTPDIDSWSHDTIGQALNAMFEDVVIIRHLYKLKAQNPNTKILNLPRGERVSVKIKPFGRIQKIEVVK